LGRSLSPGRSPGSKRFFEHESPLKMHTLSINFISFTAEMHTYTRQKKRLWHLGGAVAPSAPLNPPMFPGNAQKHIIMKQEV